MMKKAALIIFLIGLGAIVFEFATLSAIESENPWLKALPSLVPFIALIATVFFSVAKDAWVVESAKVVLGALQRYPFALYFSAFLVVSTATAFGRHIWQVASAQDGQFLVQIIQHDDIPGQRVPGIPVILEQKLRTEVLEEITDRSGRASFDVGVSDVFALRIRQLITGEPRVFVVSSDSHVSDKTRKGFQLVRLSDIPKESWIKDTDVSTETKVVDRNFAQFPVAFFRWRHVDEAQHVINVDDGRVAFPFALPGAETIIERNAFTVGFSPLLRLPRWVAYKIVSGSVIRRPIFAACKVDPALPVSYQASNYRGAHFDRGTLVYRPDMFGLGEEASRATFICSAVVPQLDYVNRRTWLALEQYTSKKATADRAIYVIRGPIYEPADDGETVNVTLMGKDLIPVPTHFFQILFVAGPCPSVEAYIVPNAYIPFDGKDVSLFQASVKEIAAKTGLIFDDKLLQ